MPNLSSNLACGTHSTGGTIPPAHPKGDQRMAFLAPVSRGTRSLLICCWCYRLRNRKPSKGGHLRTKDVAQGGDAGAIHQNCLRPWYPASALPRGTQLVAVETACWTNEPLRLSRKAILLFLTEKMEVSACRRTKWSNSGCSPRRESLQTLPLNACKSGWGHPIGCGHVLVIA